jgi:hypothetical protein
MIKQKLEQYITTKAPLQKVLKRISYPKNENKSNHQLTGNIKPQEKNRQVFRE